MPTSATPEPSLYPTEHPTLVPSSSPTLSLAPTTNEIAVPIEPAVSIAEKRLTRDSPENFEVAGALLAGLVLVQGILLVRSRFFQDNTHWLSLFARSFARTPWPTFGNMASFADAIHGLRNWTGLSFHETASSRGISISFVLRAKRQVHGWWQKFSEHASVTSESVSDLSSRFAERLTEIRIQFNDWCLNSWDHVAGASHVYPFAAAQTFLSGWYQDAFVEDVGSENTSQTPGSPHARSASMTIGQEL